jgi:uncharacterized membrane protein
MGESDTATASAASLRRAVFWVGVVAWLFAAGRALGVLFGIAYYDSESARPATRLQAKAVQLALVGIIVEGVMTVAFGLVGRALFGYAGALKRMPGESAALGEMQARCWRGAIWLAVLYVAGELASAIVEAMR